MNQIISLQFVNHVELVLVKERLVQKTLFEYLENRLFYNDDIFQHGLNVFVSIVVLTLLLYSFSQSK